MKKEIYLTFDMDWASDFVLEDFYALIEKYDLFGTLNVTHFTGLIDTNNISDYRLEYGIHPNFNNILLGKEQTNINEILANIKKLVPNAVTCRSHALTRSSIIYKQYGDYGIKYELNSYIPAVEGLRIFPYKFLGVECTILPFIFEDDIYITSDDKKTVEFYLSDKFEAPRIFNFHPIHLFLNSDNLDRYENARSDFQNNNKLIKHINKCNKGIRDFFIELVKNAQSDGWEFKKICEGVWI